MCHCHVSHRAKYPMIFKKKKKGLLNKRYHCYETMSCILKESSNLWGEEYGLSHNKKKEMFYPFSHFKQNVSQRSHLFFLN